MATGNRPDYYGVVTTIEKEGYGTRIGRTALWIQADSNQKHPIFKGKVEINGQLFHIALWKQSEKKEEST